MGFFRLFFVLNILFFCWEVLNSFNNFVYKVLLCNFSKEVLFLLENEVLIDEICCFLVRLFIVFIRLIFEFEYSLRNNYIVIIVFILDIDKEVWK